LPLARRLVETGGFGMAENLRFPVFPLLAETLFASGLALVDARAAQLVSAVATLATAGVLAAWGRERFGASALAYLPAALWLGHPIVVHASGTAYVEPLLAMFATAAWYAFDRWRREPAPGWLVVAGLCVGWAAATKYLALPLAALLGVTVLATAPSARWRSLLRFCGGLAAAATPWYLLIWVTTGNPVFPFLSEIFGGSPWSFDGSHGLDGADRGLGERCLAVLRFCWDAVLDRARVSQQPPYSPLLLLAIPSGLWAAARAAWSRPLVVALGLALAGFGWLPADSRYLLGVAPLLGVVLAVPVQELLERWDPVAARERRRWAAGVVLLTLLPGPAYAAYCVFRQGPPPSGPLATDAYLRRELPLYAAVERVNRLGGGEATLYGLHAERLIFWSAGRQIGDWNGPFRYGLVEPLLGRPNRLWRQLRGFGADYLLVPDRDRPALGRGAGLDARFREVYEDDQALVLELRAAPAPAPDERQ
jgi:hypothetical protein